MNIYISLIITMVFSAFFSGVEIAFVSVDKLRFEMERKGGITSRILSIFFKNPNEFISTMLVGNNIALVIYGILMAQIIGDNLLAGFIDNHLPTMDGRLYPSPRQQYGRYRIHGILHRPNGRTHQITDFHHCRRA